MKDVSREEFTALFQKLDTDDEVLADLLETSRTTINRWKTGKNVPTRSVRNAVVETLFGPI